MGGDQHPYRFPDTDRGLREQFAAIARASASEWEKGWELSHGMGRAVAPLLRRLLKEEPNPHHRMLHSATLALALGRVGAERDLRLILGRRGAGRRAGRNGEQVMGALILALGPPQDAVAGRELQRQLAQAQKPIDKVATLLGLCRCDAPRADVYRELGRIRDPGVLAAALYCQPVNSPGELRKLVDRGDIVRHQDLSWRGCLLSPSATTTDRDAWRVHAQQVLAKAELPGRLEAAALIGADPGKLAIRDAELSRLPFDLLLLLAADPGLRQRILGGRLRPQAHLPPTRLPLQLRHRWLVLFSCFAPIERLLGARTDWERDPSYRSAQARGFLALSLAWRVLRQPEERARLRPFLDVCAGCPESAWLRAALAEPGADPPEGEQSPGDAELRALRRGRMDPARAMQVIEQRLWRQGVHPGRAAQALHRQFLGELLLDDAGRTGYRFTPVSVEAYRPEGLDRNDPLFVRALEFFKFVTREEIWGPGRFRLR